MTKNAILSAYNIHKEISSTANPVIRKNTEFLICYCYNVSGNIVLQTKIIFQLHDVFKNSSITNKFTTHNFRKHLFKAPSDLTIYTPCGQQF